MADTDRRSETRLKRLLSNTALRVAVPLMVMLVSLYVLREMSDDVRFAEVRLALHRYAPSVYWLSFAAMCVSYVALSFFDGIILGNVSKVKLPAGVTMMTSASSMAVSNMLGRGGRARRDLAQHAADQTVDAAQARTDHR